MSDEVTHKNILAIRDYSTATRELVRSLEKELEHSNTQRDNLAARISNLESQVRSLLVKIHTGGATS